jgi:hypothetical protein
MPAFLAGGGEMGRLIAALDWGATPLGPLAVWPASLRCAVSMLVRAPTSMILLWGEGGIMIYNDGYAVIAGQRHPAILGMDVASGWPEIAAHNLSVLRTGLAGKSLTFIDQRMTLFRNGAAEDVWLDIGYSPVLGDSAAPEGVLAIVTETTSRVLATNGCASPRKPAASARSSGFRTFSAWLSPTRIAGFSASTPMKK